LSEIREAWAQMGENLTNEKWFFFAIQRAQQRDCIIH
jgi:hypothetical protein